MYLEDSFQWQRLGVYVCHYDAKAKKGKWSPQVYIPRLSPEHKHFCTYTALLTIRDLLLAHQNNVGFEATRTADVKAKTGKFPYEWRKSTPFFGFFVRNTFKPLKGETLGNYFTKYFLDNVTDSNTGQLFSAQYSQHSSRAAVASTLNDMGVPASAIAAVTLNSAATLTQTYIIDVDRQYPIPVACVERQPDKVAKLLLPYVHWITSDKTCPVDILWQQVIPGTCACSQLLLGSFNPSVVDWEQSDQEA
jgi:hypothetical protein